jgi:hypothetical protein
MNTAEFHYLNSLSLPTSKVSALDLTDQSDRTLLLGCGVDGASFHVYLQGGRIHRMVERFAVSAGKIAEFDYKSQVTWARGQQLRPDDIAYPAASDLEFCALLKFRGVRVAYGELKPMTLIGEFYGVVG